jgi:hypothetical protein
MPRSLHLPAALKAPLPSGPRVRRIPLGLARGLRFTVDFDRHLRFFVGLYESELTPWLRRFAAAGTVAYDVGADVGYQALVIARLTGATVVAFEPNADGAAQIERHFELNRDRVGPVEVVRARVGCATATGETTLDDFAARSALAAPGLLLIDVDGGELEVLEGASSLLGQAGPHVLLETHSLTLEQACLGWLRDAGYEPVIVENRRLFGDYRPAEHNRWIAAAGRA